MPKLPEKIEDWLAPWETATGTDSEIDKDRLKRYLFGLQKDKERLQESNATVTGERDELKKAADEKSREGETETDRLKRELKESQDKLAEKPAGDTKELLKLRVALKLGLDETQASRLIGETQEDLEKDAEVLLKSFGIEGKTNNEGEGESGEPRRTPRRVINNGDPKPGEGTSVDVAKALESVPRVR